VYQAFSLIKAVECYETNKNSKGGMDSLGTLPEPKTDVLTR